MINKLNNTKIIILSAKSKNKPLMRLHQEILYGDISINIALSVNIPFYRSNYIDVQRITINIDKYLRYITLFNGWKFIENLSQG